jgi:DNA polymerase-3 subunit epsilon
LEEQKIMKGFALVKKKGGFMGTVVCLGKSSEKTSRDSKGESLLELISDYVVVDLETTGLDPSWNDIIEIGAIRVEGGTIANSFTSLVNPGYEIDDFIIALTGITNEMLSIAPDIRAVLPNFLDFVDGSIVIGHNVNFDINFIYDSCVSELNRTFSNDFIDTMRLSRRLFPQNRHHRLCDLIERFNVGSTVEHRALADAIQTNHCYEYIKRYMTDNGINIESLRPKSKGFSAKDIKAVTNVFDEDSSMFKKVFVFTGALERMTRKEAMQLVVDQGGLCGDGVNKMTNYLVLGNYDYCKTIKDGKSTKQKKAEQLKLSGLDIEIISENVFYDMLDEG